jgi:DNA polymerase (family X)
MTTKEAAKIFGKIAGLLSIKGDNSFRIRAYESAVQNLAKYNEPLESFYEKITRKEVRGFGEQLTAHIQELIQTGEISILDDLKKDIPSGLQELLSIKGLSGKKIKLLHETLNIQDITSLKRACENGSIKNVKGYAEKSASALLNAVIFYENHKNMFRHSVHEEVLAGLLENCELTLLPIGNSIRKSESYTQIELLGLVTQKSKYIESLKKQKISLVNDNKEYLTFRHDSQDVDITLTLVAEEALDKESFLLSCTPAHLEYLASLHKDNNPFSKFHSPQLLYKSLNLPFFPPEMREGIHEQDFIQKPRQNNQEYLSPGYPLQEKLITDTDIQGIIHVHSTFSDGVHSIKELADAAIQQGYRYLGISDHSKSASYAGGLTEDDIKKQHEEIDQLNETLAPFRILKGIESDILRNGELDYRDTVLEWFDFVIASVHNRFSQDRKEMTNRILTAVRNPYTSILGHPTGRLLLERPQYDFDIESVIETAVESGTAIEFNSNPRRLDLPWKYLYKARRLGLKVCITPDAHAISQFEFIHYGVQFSRKAGFFPDDIINTKSASDFLGILSKNR